MAPKKVEGARAKAKPAGQKKKAEKAAEKRAAGREHENLMQTFRCRSGCILSPVTEVRFRRCRKPTSITDALRGAGVGNLRCRENFRGRDFVGTPS